jgi:hypothetical protein
MWREGVGDGRDEGTEPWTEVDGVLGTWDGPELKDSGKR